MSLKIGLDVSTIEVNKALQVLVNSAKDMTPTMTAIGRFMKSRVALSFRNSVDPYGQKWKKISNREGQDLVDTGRLRSSIQFKVTHDEALIGTNVDYARAHQFGATDTVTVPAHVRLISQAFGKKLKGPTWVNVRTHKRDQNTPARPFFPTREKGLPATWNAGILRILTKQMKAQGLI